jgi:hypothetical protein
MGFMPWTKNEQDCSNFASLISHKMYYDESKVPNYIKGYMAQYNHYNFATHSFDNLCWLTIHNFILIAFEEKGIVFSRAILCEDFKVRGAYLYKHIYKHDGKEFSNYHVSPNANGFHPVDAFSNAIVGRFAKAGCNKCHYTGENCIYCASGKLREYLVDYENRQSCEGEGWQMLSEIIGEQRTVALEDLAKFMFFWLSSQEFREKVIDNRANWAENANIGDFLESESLEKYLISGEEEDLSEEFLYDEEDE